MVNVNRKLHYAVWLLAAAVIVCIGIAVFGSRVKPANEEGVNNAKTDVDESESFVDRWAKAFCSRDAEFIAAHSDENVIKSMQESGLLTIDGSTVTFGQSSPWPVSAEDKSCYDIVKVQAGSVTINYYAINSEPHITVWQEKINFKLTDGEAKVTDEELLVFDAIDTYEDFCKAYPASDEGNITGSWIDYTQNGLGEILNQNALADREVYEQLFNPQDALRYLLNLTDEKDAIEYAQSTGENTQTIRVTFKKDNVYMDFKMVQMTDEDGNYGIWIPCDAAPDDFYAQATLINSYKLDLTNDKIDDEIRVYLLGAAPEETLTSDLVEKLVSSDNYRLEIKFFDGAAADSDSLIEVGTLAAVHMQNAQFSIVGDSDGNNYILESSVYEINGSGVYEYSVYDYSKADKNIVDSFSVSFEFDDSKDKLHKVTDFKNHIEKWLDAGTQHYQTAVLIAATDVSNTTGKYTFVPMPDTDSSYKYESSVFYNNVWERTGIIVSRLQGPQTIFC
jgi:hypothetical protein